MTLSMEGKTHSWRRHELGSGPGQEGVGVGETGTRKGDEVMKGTLGPLKKNRHWAGLVVQRLSVHVLLQRPGVHRFGSWVWTWHRLSSYAVVGVPHIK